MPHPLPADAPRAPNPVLDVIGSALERTLNRLVDLDPDTRRALAALDGRAIRVDLVPTPLAMRIAVAGPRLEIGPAFAGDSALRVAAGPAALLGLALARGRGDAMRPGRIEVSGDAELARRLERIAARFAPDFDAAFARVFGDVAGVGIAKGLRGALGGLARSGRALARDAADYLTEESRALVARAELETFLDEVDALRERTDRLDARVRRLAGGGKTAA